jgi:N-acetylmuramoyl-L-alanine amidase
VARPRRLLAAGGAAGVSVIAFTFALAGTAATATAPPVIAIDVGHSLSRPGAISARGEPEFAFNRGLALVVERVLRQRGFRKRLIGEQGDMENLTDQSERRHLPFVVASRLGAAAIPRELAGEWARGAVQ